MYEIHTEDIIKAQNKSDEAMTKIIENNSGLVWSIVNRYTGRGYSKEELYQIGCIGFIKAVQRFDTSFDVKISTYAVPYIIGEIKRFLRDDGPVKLSRSIKELANKIKEVQRNYTIQNGEEPTITYLSKALGVAKEDIIQTLDAIRPVESIDEETYQDDSDGESKISKISNNQDETGALINKLCIKQLIMGLNEREKQIILLRYYKEKTQTEVAKILGITQVQVSRIEKKILAGMRQKIAI